MISGTSVDAIDVALADMYQVDDTLTLTTLGYLELPWPAAVRERLLAALPPASPGPAEWVRLHAETGEAFGAAAARALTELGPADLVVSHGQTLHHLVERGRVVGTLQLGDPARVHAHTGLPVLADLRAADIAAGGPGAPLASTLDALWLGDVPTAAVNLGGIANVTIVGTDDGPVTGDTGPANCLLDAAAADLGLRCDVDGALAAAGRVDEAALGALLADPYFARPLPKSTGREHFHAGYVRQMLGAATPTGPDLFTTLVELSARTIADVVRRHRPRRLVVSGGGAANPLLIQRLSRLTGLQPSDCLGLPAAAKEAYLMALIGWLSWHGLPGVARGPAGPVTGAARAAVLGSLTPPRAVADLAPAPTRLVVEAAGAGAGARSETGGGRL